jgi:hypothetical protein
MICSSLLGWAQFMPPAIHSFGPLYVDFISSPVGLGTGPDAIGGYLMIACGFVFVGHALFLMRHTIADLPLWLVIVNATTVSYIVLSVAQFYQIQHWINARNTSGEFTTPSGRTLTTFDGGPGVGAGLSVIAMGLAIGATVLLYRQVNVQLAKAK